ncbi:RDD family protein [Nocardioides sp.]|uniref:RDD family protein n=1 Tax=Nocardioides sp. TaxID=35761 RepID=UPI002733D69A|nr:RDD family protein [Nocardioides sp.]MDP3893794.1 RDD family protein [Nocardioides sp.]
MSGPAEYAALTADDLVTSEAVALDLPPASLASRMVSGLVDVTLTLLALLAVTFVLTVAALQSGEALLWVAYIGTLIVVFLVLPTTVETLTRGKSLGKWMMGLRTVRDDAGPITFQHTFVRSLVAIVEVYVFMGVPAFFSAMLSTRGKRLGDYAAGTYVVRERFRLELPPPVAMPGFLAAWATTADIASLPTSLALGVRQFLGRAPHLQPGPRQEMAGELAARVAAYVAPAPPPGTPPEAFLAAVVAARRERDTARLAREDALRRRLTRS